MWVSHKIKLLLSMEYSLGVVKKDSCEMHRALLNSDVLKNNFTVILDAYEITKNGRTIYISVPDMSKKDRRPYIFIVDDEPRYIHFESCDELIKICEDMFR